MRQFNVLQAIPLSFFSRPLYRDVALRWSGAAIGYLLLVLFLFWTPRAIRLHLRTQIFCTVRAPGVLRQIPPFRIKDGRLWIEAEMPVMIRDPQGGKLLAVIDTTGRFTSPRQAGCYALMTGTQLMVERPHRSETRTWDFPPRLDFRYAQANGFSWLAVIGAWFATVIGLLGLFLSWITAIIKVLILAALGLALMRKVDATASFQTAFRLAAVSITPALLYDLLRAWFAWNPPLGWWIGLLISVTYLWFAVESVRMPQSGSAAIPPPATPPPPAGPAPLG